LLDQGRGGIKTTVQEHRAYHRLHRVGQDGWPLGATTAGLAFGQAQHLVQAQHQGRPVQAVLAHQVGTHPGQVALVGYIESVEQQTRDGQAQGRIAQKFQPLVVVGAETAVGERTGEQGGVGKPIAQAVLQRRKARVHEV
jgi:hypothetical protein